MNFKCQKSKKFEIGVTHFIGQNGIGENTHILGNAVTSQHGALLSDDIKALKTNR